VLGFIDVPGHERFVHNMLAGATGIDTVLLVVAADDGVMPQTREHLEIVELLGIAHGVVALTKIDVCRQREWSRCGQRLNVARHQPAGRQSGVFRYRSINGTGIEVLRVHLESLTTVQRSHADDGDFRLAVDRCFTLTGSARW